MNQSDIDGMLKQSLTDGKLPRAEKSVLREILTCDADMSPNHMHHRFAVFDGRNLISGSRSSDAKQHDILTSLERRAFPERGGFFS